MTRKACSNHSHVDDVLQSVCYNFCYLDYGRLRGRSNVANQKYIRRSSRFFHLEDFCNADKSALQLFLKINGITLSKRVNNTKSTALMTRNKMPRTRTSSVCDKIKQSPLSPTGSETGHWLRTRRRTAFSNSFLDTSGDDDSNHVKPMRELRSSTKSLLKSLEPESDTWESGRPKRTCIKQKRISVDERLVTDDKTYKAEIRTNNLKYSGLASRETEIPKKSKAPVSEESEDDKGLIVKFRRLRNSELTRLNNEAENFLFPRKNSSSSEDDTDAESQNSKSVRKSGNDRTSKSNKHVQEEETSMDSVLSEMSVTQKRKRLTQAEAFILDNQRYYKFETPGSRLRYQGSYLAPVAAKNNGEYSTKQAKHKHVLAKTASKFDLKDLKFSFESVPTSEPWYNTFQRQDNGDEYYITYNEPGFYKPFLLPYEMGPLPPLDPRICVHNYNQMKKRFLSETIASSSAIFCKSDFPYDTISKPDTNSNGEIVRTSATFTIEPPPTDNLKKSRNVSKQTPGRRGIYVPTKNPRKSPRQHASTLAILSSLIQQRKRRDMHKSKRSDHNTSKHSLPSITEEEREMQELEQDYESIAKNINDMLSNSAENVEPLEILQSDSIDVNVHCASSAVESLEDFVSREHNLNDFPSKSLSENVVRKSNRKKKKNRTGWPNKNRRTVFRKEGSNSRDGLGGSENSNSIVNSPSVPADSEENDEEIGEDTCSKNSLPKLSEYAGDAISDKIKSNDRSTNTAKVNGDVQTNKLNGINDSYELSFKSLGTPKRKEHRESSSDNCAEVVIASVGDKIDCVNVDLAKWENAERVLAARLRNESINSDMQFQPVVRVQKLDSEVGVKRAEKRIQSSPTPRRTRPRRSMPASPKSPRMLRRPRGGWYRERYY